MQFFFIGVSIGIQGTNDRAGYPPSTAFFKVLIISWLYYLTLRIIFLFLKLSARLKIYLGVLWCFVLFTCLFCLDAQCFEGLKNLLKLSDIYSYSTDLLQKMLASLGV